MTFTSAADLGAFIGRMEAGLASAHDPETGRRLSLSQLKARHRALVRHEQRERGEQIVAEEESRYRETLDGWREMPRRPMRQEFEAQLAPRQFDEAEPPSAPDHGRELSDFEVSAHEQASAALSWSTGKRGGQFLVRLAIAGLAWGVIAVVAPMVSDSPDGATSSGSLLASLVCAIAAFWVASAWFNRRHATRVNAEAEAIVAREWQPRWAAIGQRHAAKLEEFRAAEDQRQREWVEAEEARIASLRSLLAGDEDTIARAIEEAVEGVDAPFDMSCSVAVESLTTAFLDLDLPEIEDIIEGTKKRVLKDGSIKETARKKADQYKEYAGVAVGIGLRIAGEAFSVAPTVETVHVAAFTQRVSRKTGNVENQYVFSFKVERSAFDPLNFERIDAVVALENFEHDIKQKASGHLDTIRPPEWAVADADLV